MSKLRYGCDFRINPEGACLLSGWHSVYRWHETNPVLSMERGNLVCNVKRNPIREIHERGKYQCAHKEADHPVVVMKFL